MIMTLVAAALMTLSETSAIGNPSAKCTCGVPNDAFDRIDLEGSALKIIRPAQLEDLIGTSGMHISEVAPEGGNETFHPDHRWSALVEGRVEGFATGTWHFKGDAICVTRIMSKESKIHSYCRVFFGSDASSDLYAAWAKNDGQPSKTKGRRDVFLSKYRV